MGTLREDLDQARASDWTVGERADLERWRGKTDALVHAQVQRFGDFTAAITTAMSDLDRNMNRRFDKAEQESAEIKTQVKETNGSVRSLKEWRVGIDAHIAHEAEYEQREVENEERRLHQRQFGFSTLVGAIGATGTIVGAISGVLALIHVI